MMGLLCYVFLLRSVLLKQPAFSQMSDNQLRFPGKRKTDQNSTSRKMPAQYAAELIYKNTGSPPLSAGRTVFYTHCPHRNFNESYVTIIFHSMRAMFFAFKH